MNVFIYCLSDPRTGEIRYVGKAVDTRKRLKSHLTEKPHTRKGNWVKSMIRDGVKPELEILETIFDSDDFDWQESERWWIAYLRFIGCRLTNMETGGIGGRKRDREATEKMRASLTGRKRSPEAVAKTAATNTGSKRSEETRAKMRASGQSKIISQEARQRMSDAARKGHTGLRASEETKAKMRAARAKQPPPSAHTLALRSEALKGKPLSPEHCAKLSVAAKARWAKL